jgi:acetate kinase
MKNVLVLNAGSSSLKFGVYEAWGTHVDETPKVRGLFEFANKGATLSVTGADSASSSRSVSAKTHAEAIGVLMELLQEKRLVPDAVGHRVVHGGGVYTVPVIVDEAHYVALEGFIPLAPLHQPHNLAPIAALMEKGMSQVACFDTGFHGTIPRLNREYALPPKWTAKGYRKFGFHGLSYEYIASILRSVFGCTAQGRVIVAHLGSGASLCGMKNLKSVVTTLEFSTIGRLPMGTRPGAVDAVMALEMAREVGIDEVIRILHKESGLLALSGVSADVRVLEDEAREGNPDANLALEFFAEQVAQEIGKLVAALRGFDALVFTAGIGERGSMMRVRICEKLDYFGVELDYEANMSNSRIISTPDARVRVAVIPTNEELVIARHTARLVC